MSNLFGFLKKSSLTIGPDQIMAALGQVLEPEVNRDIVSLGMVRNVACQDGMVSFTIRLREAGSPLQIPLERMARRAVLAIPGVKAVDLNFETGPKSQLRDTTRLNLDAKHVVAVASGKGGVGKSTVAVNLAVALAQTGQRVGLLDGDIHGPNVPLMLGITDEQPFAFGEQIFPPSAYGLKVMSMGLLVPAEAPIIWRGPMMHQAIRQLLRDVMWGVLDVLVVDLPPGTGDVQLTLTQSLPLSGVVMVTTPQDVAVADVIKGTEMFRQLDVNVLGFVENMSYYVCPHCGQEEAIFGQNGGERLSRQLGMPLLGRIPLDPRVRQGGDTGQPVVVTAPDSPAGQALRQAAETTAAALRALSSPRSASPSYTVYPELRLI
ncbi:MAG: Mrp/NBP35 family ATP-binding protein [Chloroflexi bacterium]|nr:Mrp/NBP35 family ATP-binding protein [Chloroflexota bacterium]